MTREESSAARLSSEERAALRAHLTAARTSIVDAWASVQFEPARLTRWEVAGVNGQDVDTLKHAFVAPLFELLRGWLVTAEPRWRAVYLDERLRYAPHQASPTERATFFAEIIARDEAAVLEGLPPTLRTATQTALADLHAPLLAPRAAGSRLLAVGDCLMNEIRVFLPDASRSRGFDADMRCLYFSAFTGRDISTAQVRAFLAAHPMDVLAFSFLSYEGLPLYSAFLREADRLKSSELDQRAAAIVGLMRRFLTELREVTDAPFLVHNASGLPLTRARRVLPILDPLSAGRRRAVAALNTAIGELVEHLPNAILVDEAAVAQARGHRAAMAPVVDHAKEAQFHTARFGEYLAAEYADVLASYERLRKAKVLAVDFDNTLWQGVMADGPVEQHHERQRLLKAAKDAGMLLVAVSKNDPANIRWSEMTLAPDDFVLRKIGWDLKVESISSAATQLDLGLDSFVFIDDNPAECELVRQQLPKVRILDATDAFAWRSIDRLLQFPNTKDTEEARTRTEMYRQQAQRQETLSGGFDYAAMMAQLDLSIEFRRATTRDLDRVTELVQRTNQFNTTTKRYSRQQLQSFLESDRHRVFVAALSDKFGALGLVLTAIVERGENEATFDSFIMSCRAMGFQLEQAVVRLVMDTERRDTRWKGVFVPTDRNTPSASLYADCGFQNGGAEWILESDAERPALPAWFRVRAG